MEASGMINLTEIQDDILLLIFQRLQPLPDLFSVAATCRRFRPLAMDKRRWLRVSPSPPLILNALGTSDGWQGAFKTLEEAIRSSRPGDTIWLAPGAEHRVEEVSVDWALHLRGGGQYPEDTVLTCPKGAAMGLDFRATCLLANVSVSSTLSPCILHRSGHLKVERCLLECFSGGLDHLTSPIVTVAVSGPSRHDLQGSLDPHTAGPGAGGPSRGIRPLSARTTPLKTGPNQERNLSDPNPNPSSLGYGLPSADPGRDAHRTKKHHSVVVAPASSLAASSRPGNARDTSFSAGAGPGKLVVVDTRLSGGGKGVQCRGTGVLQGVRAIYGAGRMPLFFFEVDARCGGNVSLQQQPLAFNGQSGVAGPLISSSAHEVTRVLAGIDPQRILKALASSRQER